MQPTATSSTRLPPAKTASCPSIAPCDSEHAEVINSVVGRACAEADQASHPSGVTDLVCVAGSGGQVLRFPDANVDRGRPYARAYSDAQVTLIYGGTNEVMKTIIAKSLGI